MTSRRIETIPIAEIRVMNPRSRNRKTFQGILKSIATVGLKNRSPFFHASWTKMVLAMIWSVDKDDSKP